MTNRNTIDKKKFEDLAPHGFKKKLELNGSTFEMCQDMASDSLRGYVCWCLYAFWLEDKPVVNNGEIVEATGLSDSEVSVILTYLGEKGVIVRKKKGKFMMNQFSDRSINFLQQVILGEPAKR